MARLLDLYNESISKKMIEKFEYENVNQVPKLVKIVLSTGIGNKMGRDAFEEATRMFAEITGQRPVITKARKSVASFKIREGANVGSSVTLRNKIMYDFLYRLNNIALPRVRDFRGVSRKSFDGFGNYTFGITDQSIFTEINLDRMKHTIGMNVTIVTTAKTDEEALELLKLFGVPFAK